MQSSDRRNKERRNEAVPIKAERRKKERRTTQRRDDHRVALELWMEEVAGSDVYFRRSGNVSAGGVFFDKAIPHVPGTVVTLKFALPGDPEMVVARGEVVNAAHADQGLGMSVKFVTLEGNGEQRLRHYMSQRN